MSIVGHKTESIYRRYAIVDEAMQREAAARLDAFTSAPTTGKQTGTVSTFMPKAAKAQNIASLAVAVMGQNPVSREGSIFKRGGFRSLLHGYGRSQ
jgi:hypothetical protein